MQELERGDSGLRSFVSVQSGLVMYPIYAFGSKEQKDKWIPKLGKAEAIGCFGLTEPDFGSNPAGMRTVAKKDGDSYVLNGAKAWITNGSIADVAVVWAKLDGVVRGFLVEKGTKGFSTFEHKGKMSLRASVTSQLAFEDCRIPAENILPGVEGLKGPLSCLTQARYGIAWGALGSAMATYQAALDYSKTRKQWKDRPIAAHQLVQERLAWMITEITKGAAARVEARPDEGRQDASSRTTCPWPSATTSGSPASAPSSPAKRSAPTAWSTSTRSSATWPTSRASTPTRGRTTSTR